MSLKNKQQYVYMYALDTTNNVPATGQASAIDAAVTIQQNDSNSSPSNTVGEGAIAGLYYLLVTAAESNYDAWGVGIVSSVVSESVIVTPLTRAPVQLPDAAPAANGGLPTVDANNRIVGVQGTKNTFDALNDISEAQSLEQCGSAIVAALPTGSTTIAAAGITALNLDDVSGGGGGGDATAANQVLILEDLVDMKGTGFVKDTDSLKTIRDNFLTAQGAQNACESAISDASLATSAQLAAGVEVSDKTGFSLAAAGLDSITFADLSALPSNFREGLQLLVMALQNETTQTGTKFTIKNSGGTAVVEATTNDDDTTQTKGALANS